MQPPVDPEREELHRRQIDMHAYRRSDGLFEVEAHLMDRKPHPFVPWRGDRLVPAGECIHEMKVTIVFDEALYVRGIRAHMLATPYAHCPQAQRSLETLIGAQMSKGWGPLVRSRLGGERSCTHLMELMVPMATVAYQSLSASSRLKPERLDATGRPAKINSCFAYGTGQALVQVHWPEYFSPKA